MEVSSTRVILRERPHQRETGSIRFELLADVLSGEPAALLLRPWPAESGPELADALIALGRDDKCVRKPIFYAPFDEWVAASGTMRAFELDASTPKFGKALDECARLKASGRKLAIAISHAEEMTAGQTFPHSPACSSLGPRWGGSSRTRRRKARGAVRDGRRSGGCRNWGHRRREVLEAAIAWRTCGGSAIGDRATP